MNHHGVILRKLRMINQLSIKDAAQRIGRAAGWLSEVENGKGSARIHSQEFDRVVGIYGGEAYRKHFPLWVASSCKKQEVIKKDIEFTGSILKYLRKKTGITLETAADKVGLSKSYLSYLEGGMKPVSLELRNRLMRCYGYSPSSFRNFATEDKRAKNIPIRYKLGQLLKQMDETQVSEVFGFAIRCARSVEECGRVQIDLEVSK